MELQAGESQDETNCVPGECSSGGGGCVRATDNTIMSRVAVLPTRNELERQHDHVVPVVQADFLSCAAGPGCVLRRRVAHPAENLAGYLAARERGDTEARWGELVPPHQDLATSIR